MELDRVSNVPVVAGVVSDVEDEALPVGISELQAAVLRLMIGGSTLTEAARKVVVARKSVYRWRDSNPAFALALERVLDEKKCAIKVDVMALAEDALVNVQMAVASGKDPRLCLMLLKYLGLLKPTQDLSDRP
jgi:hypothetical protein